MTGPPDCLDLRERQDFPVFLERRASRERLLKRGRGDTQVLLEQEVRRDHPEFQVSTELWDPRVMLVSLDEVCPDCKVHQEKRVTTASLELRPHLVKREPWVHRDMRELRATEVFLDFLVHQDNQAVTEHLASPVQRVPTDDLGCRAKRASGALTDCPELQALLDQ